MARPTKLKERLCREKLGRRCPRTPRPLSGDVEVLDLSPWLFQARQLHREAMQDKDASDEGRRMLQKQAATWTCCWHKAFRMTKTGTIRQVCREYRLKKIDREILILLLLIHFGQITSPRNDCGELLDLLGHSAARRSQTIRAISENGKLAKKGLLGYKNLEEKLAGRIPVLNPLFIEAVISHKPYGRPAR